METIRHQTSGGYTALPSGAVIDRYCIDSVIASGGFGITYLCHHTSLNKTFALKEHFPRQLAFREGNSSNIKPTDPDTFNWALDRFVQEGRSLAQCSHPNVVTVSDVFEANSTAYMVLGFEQGQSLKSWVSSLQRRPNQEEIDRFLVPLLSALDYVHSKQLLHRDIAPDNIMIRDDGTPCLIDFGAARQAVAEKSQLMSAIVKSGFSPPEQYTRSGRSQGPWSDIYALSAALYWVVTGETPQESTERVVDDDYQSLSERQDLQSKYRASFLNAIDHGLKLKYQDRPQTVSSWSEQLIHDRNPTKPSVEKSEAQKKEAAKSISFTELPARNASVEPERSSRSRMGVMALVVLVLLLVGAGWWLGKNSSTSDPASQQAESSRREAELLKAKADLEQQLKKEAERQAAIKVEAERKAAEAREAALKEQARIKAEQERQAAIEAEAERKAAEAREAALKEQARIKAEQERQAAIKAEAERKAAEAREAALKEQARIKAEEERQAAIKAEAERKAAEAREAALKEQARIKAEEERQAALKAEEQQRADAIKAQRQLEEKSKYLAELEAKKQAELAAQAEKLAKITLVKSLQEQMKKLGCYNGAIDGNWSVSSKLSLHRLSKVVGLEIVEDPTQQIVSSVSLLDGRICSPQCSSEEQEIGGKCVRKPPPPTVKEKKSSPPSQAKRSDEETPRKTTEGKPSSSCNCGDVCSAMPGLVNNWQIRQVLCDQCRAKCGR